MPELTAVLLRTGREFALVTSRFDDPDGRRRVQEVIQAAAIRRRLRDARVALVGHHFEGMTDLMFDGLSMRQDIGPVVWPLEPEKVAVRFGEIAQADVDAVDGRRAGQATRSRWSPPSSSARCASRWPSSRSSRSTASTPSRPSTRSG